MEGCCLRGFSGVSSAVNRESVETIATAPLDGSRSKARANEQATGSVGIDVGDRFLEPGLCLGEGRVGRLGGLSGVETDFASHRHLTSAVVFLQARARCLILGAHGESAPPAWQTVYANETMFLLCFVFAGSGQCRKMQRQSRVRLGCSLDTDGVNWVPVVHLAPSAVTRPATLHSPRRNDVCPQVPTYPTYLWTINVVQRPPARSSHSFECQSFAKQGSRHCRTPLILRLPVSSSTLQPRTASHAAEASL